MMCRERYSCHTLWLCANSIATFVSFDHNMLAALGVCMRRSCRNLHSQHLIRHSEVELSQISCTM